MQAKSMKSTIPGLALAATLSLVAPHAGAQTAAPNPPADRWTFSVTPYLWLPGIDAKLNYGPPAAGSPTPNVGVDADALLRALDFGLMFNGEARRGRWLVATDFNYGDVGGGSSATTWQLAGGVGYAFRWGEIVADYRRLHYSAGGSRLIDTLDAGGLSLGARIPF
jgi:hypothetical protein